MIFVKGTPLSWLLVIHDRRRFLKSIVAVMLAVTLMTVQVGFLFGVLDSQAMLVNKLRGDLVIASSRKFTIAYADPIPRARLAQARAVEGVAGVHPLYQARVTFKDLEHGVARQARVLGVDPRHKILDIPEIAEHAAVLESTSGRLPALIDRKSRATFGDRAAGMRAELGPEAVDVAGTFELGTELNTEGTLLIAAVNFPRLFADPKKAAQSLSRPEIGIIQLTPGARREEVQATLSQALPEDVRVYTFDQFNSRERKYWLQKTGAGGAFGIGCAVGFLVGLMIMNQILSSEIMRLLDQFATLKAMGYADRSVLGVVVEEAIIITLAGFGPGLAVSAVAYEVTARLTALVMRFTPGRVAFLLALSLVMSLSSALLASRRLSRADPADIF